jgi:hypothetical protein
LIEDLIKSQLNLVHAQELARNPVKRQPYQARFSRIFTAGDPRQTIGINSTRSLASTRTIGPIVIIAKTTNDTVQSDSFDGNIDGYDDVKKAKNDWAAVNGQGGQAAALDEFLRKVRSRAEINGGSIGLRGLVVTGRNSLGNFITFNKDTICITPCFPVTDEENYNLQFYAGGLDNAAGATLLASPQLSNQLFFDINGDFIDRLEGFTLVRESGVLPAVVGPPAESEVVRNQNTSQSNQHILASHTKRI